MNFYLEIETTQPVEKSHFFREGFLAGLSYLTRFGHKVAVDVEQLSDQQRALLNQEHIDVSEPNNLENTHTISLDHEANAYLVIDKLNIEASNWIELANRVIFPERKVELSRNTSETSIELSLNLDGKGESDIQTGLHFFDHMLDQIAKHGLIDLAITCDGDLEVDEHHTIEDVAITLGTAIKQALGDKIGITRYGFVLPMDEAQARVALDFSGRPFFKFKGQLEREYVGDFPTEMLEHFFYSLAINVGATLHIHIEGDNDHHNIEAAFKGFARALREAVKREERTLNILPSSKGIL
mgnify:CR=1 FL=1